MDRSESKHSVIAALAALALCIAILPARAQWVQTNGIDGPTVFSISSIGDSLVAGTSSDYVHFGGIFLSTDDGLTWALMKSDLPTYTDVHSFCKMKNAKGEERVFIGTETGPFCSTNHGANWMLRNDRNVWGATIVVADAQYLYACTNTDGLFRSSDDGITWEDANDGIPELHVGRPGARATQSLLSIQDPRFEWGFFVGVEGVHHINDTCRILRSSDHGETWQNTGNGIPPFSQVYCLAAGPTVSGHPDIYAGTVDGFFHSTDYGNSWIKSATGLGAHIINSIAAVDHYVFAGTDKGVYCSWNVSSRWFEANEGFSYHDIRSLFIFGKYIYAGTSGLGVWRRPLSELIPVDVEQPQMPTAFTLDQNYPNPITGQTSIGYALHKPEYMTLKVYNALGAEVATVMEGRQNAGRHTARFDATGLPAGMYFYRLAAGGRTIQRKMAVVK